MNGVGPSHFIGRYYFQFSEQLFGLANQAMINFTHIDFHQKVVGSIPVLASKIVFLNYGLD